MDIVILLGFRRGVAHERYPYPARGVPGATHPSSPGALIKYTNPPAERNL